MGCSIEKVLQRERSRLLSSIRRLDEALAPYHNGDPMANGNRAVKALQYEQLEIVESLLLLKDDPLLILGLCEEWLKTALQEHQRISEGHLTNKKHNDIWWHSLDQVRFITRLLRCIEENVTDFELVSE